MDNQLQMNSSWYPLTGAIDTHKRPLARFQNADESEHAVRSPLAGHQQVVTASSARSREVATRLACATGMPDEHEWHVLLAVNPSLAHLRDDESRPLGMQGTIALESRF